MHLHRANVRFDLCDAISKFNQSHKQRVQSKLISKVSVFLGMSEQFANLCQNEFDHVELVRFTHSPTAAYLFNFIDRLIFWRCVNLSNLRLYHNEYYPKVQAIACNNVQCTHDVNVLVFFLSSERTIEIANFCHLRVCGPWLFQLFFFVHLFVFISLYFIFSAKRFVFYLEFRAQFSFRQTWYCIISNWYSNLFRLF